MQGFQPSIVAHKLYFFLLYLQLVTAEGYYESMLWYVMSFGVVLLAMLYVSSDYWVWMGMSIVWVGLGLLILGILVDLVNKALISL